MVPYKRQAIVRRHHPMPRVAQRQLWERKAFTPELPERDARDSQVIRGLLYGVPVALALWIAVGMLAWGIV
ncbi:MAG: hypothetical protein JWM38_1438 [Sphingomonas bacterium]|jgi:hypothetical protein|nr:hypothetical protein [Sphingomonas bacterium]